MIQGLSGAGKTILTELCYGARTAGRGQVKVFGRDVRRLRASSLARLRRRLGIVSQRPLLLEKRSALANAGAPLKLRGEAQKHIDARAHAALDEAGFSDSRRDVRVSALSAGERRLVAFARALIADPEVILVDEPAESLDPGGVARLLAVLDERKVNGAAVIATTSHAQIGAAVMRWGWHVAELRDGELMPLPKNGAGLLPTRHATATPVELACADTMPMVAPANVVEKARSEPVVMDRVG